MEDTWKKGNCMTGCKHHCMRQIYKKEVVKDDDGNIFAVLNEFDGYEHYCDIDSPNYKEWHDRNANNTYEVYKKDNLTCYEPTELTKKTGKMIDLMNDILANIKE